MFEARCLVGALLLTVSFVQAAEAEVTADRVWSDWQAQAASFGFELKGDALRDGNALRVTGARVVFGDKAAIFANEVTLTEGASDVSVTFGSGLESEIAGDAGNTINVTLTSPDLTLAVTEAGGGLAYAYTATDVKTDYATLMTIPGLEGEPPMITKSSGSITINGLSGQISPSSDTNGRRDFAVAMKQMSYATLDSTEGNEFAGMSASSESVTDDLVMQGQITLPPAHPLSGMSSPADFAAAVQAGLAVMLSGSQGKSTGSSTMESSFFSFDLDMTSVGGTFDLAFDNAAFAVNSETGAISFALTSPLMPVPDGKVDMAGATIHLVAPLQNLDTPQDFTVSVAMGDVVLSDGIWGLFDPSAALPRTPANLVIDVTGKVVWQPFALLAAETTAVAVPPPEVTEVKLNNLQLSAAGAEVTGKGLVNIDWSAVSDAGGAPMPLGTLDFTLTGVNKLLDNVTAAGLIPADQTEAPRMMLGLFATPAEGEDVMTSKIEFRDDGGLYANGQRMQ